FLLRFSAAERRRGIKLLGKFGAGSSRIRLDNIALQTGKRAEQLILFSSGNVEFIERLDKVFDQRGEFTVCRTHVLVRGGHIATFVFASTACSEADESFEIRHQAARISPREFFVDAIVLENDSGELVNDR